MRRKTVGLLAAAALLLCGGCAAKTAEGAPTPSPTPVAASAPAPTPTLEPEPTEAAGSYENIAEVTYAYHGEKVDLEIKYPYLCGPAEDREINDLLRQEALGKWLDADVYDAAPGSMGNFAHGDWLAARNDKHLLSIYFTQYYGAGGPTGNDHWGVTVNRERGARLALGDIVDTGDDLAAWLGAQDWTVLEQWQGGGDEVGKDRARMEYLLPLYEKYSAEHIRDFYLTDTELRIIVWDGKYDTHLSVPLADLKLKGDDLWNG